MAPGCAQPGRIPAIAALGGTEVRFAAPGLSTTERIDRLHRMVAGCVEKVAAVPIAGQQARVVGMLYELRQGNEKGEGTGPEVLEMVPTGPR